MLGDTFTVFDYLLGLFSMLGEGAQSLFGVLGGLLGGLLGGPGNTSMYDW